MDTQKDKATPRPWSLETNIKGNFIRPSIGRIITRDNAELIVNAVNNHTALLEACIIAESALSSASFSKIMNALKLIRQAINQATK